MPNQATPPSPTPGLVPRRDPPEAPPVSAAGLRHFALRTAVAVLVAVLILLVVYILWQGVRELVEAFAGVLFAVFLTALTDWLKKYTRLPRGVALAVVVVALFAVAGGLGYLLANRLMAETVQLTKELPQSLRKVQQYVAESPWAGYLLNQLPNSGNSLASASEWARVTGLVSGVLDFAVAILVIFFVGLFGAAEPALYQEGLLHLVPPGRRPRVAQALAAVACNLRWWLVGQFCLMFAMGTTTALGLWLIGIDLPLALGVIAGVLELIPYLGPWLSAVPAALIALLMGPWHLLAVLGLFLVLHVLEGYVFVPLVQRRSIHLPPALTLFAQVLLGALLGLLGLFVAAPLTVSVVVFLKMLYVEDTLGDTTVKVAGEKPAAAPGVTASGTT